MRVCVKRGGEGEGGGTVVRGIKVGCGSGWVQAGRKEGSVDDKGVCQVGVVAQSQIPSVKGRLVVGENSQ